jgi:hypothetical protein
MCRCVRFTVAVKNSFVVTYKLRVKYKIGRRNRYLEGRNDRQMTPRGYPNFNSYMKNLRVLVFRTDRRTDGRTDRQTEKLIWCGLGHLSDPSG